MVHRAPWRCCSCASSPSQAPHAPLSRQSRQAFLRVKADRSGPAVLVGGGVLPDEGLGGLGFFSRLNERNFEQRLRLGGAQDLRLLPSGCRAAQRQLGRASTVCALPGTSSEP